MIMRTILGFISFVSIVVCYVLFGVALSKGHADEAIAYIVAGYAGGTFLMAFEENRGIVGTVLLGLLGALFVWMAITIRTSLHDPVARDTHAICSRVFNSPVEVCDYSAHCSPLTGKYCFRHVLAKDGKDRPFSRYSRCSQCGRMYCHHYFFVYSTEEWLQRIRKNRAVADAMSYPDP